MIELSRHATVDIDIESRTYLGHDFKYLDTISLTQIVYSFFFRINIRYNNTTGITNLHLATSQEKCKLTFAMSGGVWL